MKTETTDHTGHLRGLMDGRTTIMVRPTGFLTIQHADKIIVEASRVIKESGTHQELLVEGWVV